MENNAIPEYVHGHDALSLMTLGNEITDKTEEAYTYASNSVSSSSTVTSSRGGEWTTEDQDERSIDYTYEDQKVQTRQLSTWWGIGGPS